MTTHHLMGLGLSPGAVTGPITYLAYRYQRWNEEDRRFFARSGESGQHEAGGGLKPSKLLVLYATRERPGG